MKNNSGFIWLPVIIGVGLLALLSAVALIPAPDPIPSDNSDSNLGTAAGNRINYTNTLIPSADNAYDLGTSTAAYRAGYINTLTVSSCTGCTTGLSFDLQDVYNASASNAEILTANSKDIVIGLADTATDANFIIDNLGGKGSLLMQSASTTMGSWSGYGRLAIGTTTPGAGLSVATTSNLMSLTVEGNLKAGDLTATSSLNYIGTATSTWAGAGLSVAGGGLASSQGLTITGGDFLSSGKLTITNAGTSTIPVLDVSTLLNAAALFTSGPASIGGKLEVNGAATSTFAGPISGTHFGGTSLTLSSDLLLSGKLTILSTATSSNAGQFFNTGLIRGSALIVGGTKDLADNPTMINCAEGNFQTFDLTANTAIGMKNCYGGQTLRLGIFVASDSDGLTVDWDGPVASSSLMWPSATTTTGYLEQGKPNLCSFAFATGTDGSTAVAFSQCSLGYEFR